MILSLCIMPSYDVQFSGNDVFDRFQKVRGLKDEQKDTVLAFYEHELFSEIRGSFEIAKAFTDGKIESYGKQPNIHQIGYVNNLNSSGRLVLASLEDLLNSCTKKGKLEDVEKEGREASESFVRRINGIAQYLPATKRILELGNLAPKRQEVIEGLDFAYGLAFYTYNNVFARHFQRDIYNLREDLKRLWNSQFARTKTSVEMRKGNIVTIETNVDYLGNVVMPLIKNIQQHAFNPQNDIEGRLQNTEEPFHRFFEVYDKVDEENQQIVITVRDFGFGIRPEIHEILFQRGASTKIDTETEHGVGLWLVRKFVEANGGKIWVESELGKGTSFHFTIPYREKNHFVYKQ